MATRRYPVPLDGSVYRAVLPFRGRGIIVANNSTVAVTVTDDSGHAYTAPAGAREAFNSGGIYVPSYQSAGVGTGVAEVEFHSGIVDTSANTATQQPAGTVPVNVTGGNVTVSGNTNATITAISGGVTIPISAAANIPVNVNNSGPVSISGNVNSTITSVQAGVNINTTDLIIEQNTGILTGLLPSSTTAFALASGTEQASVIAGAVPGFGLTAIIAGAGRLNVWLVASSSIVYLLRDIPFFNGPNSGSPIEKRFAVPIPAFGVLHTRWDDATTSATFILRF